MHQEARVLRPFNPASPATCWLHPDDYAQKRKDGSRIPGGLVYRFYDADQNLIYVGQTTSTHTYPIRWTGHKTSSPWWGIAAYYSVDRVTSDAAELLALEAAAIRTERPRFNKQHAKSRASFRVFACDGPVPVIEQFRTHLLPDDFAALVKAFKAEPDGA